MGVKQLWTLLGPVGRPVLLETMEGKALAIDSSIWIYQFQATMRDKEGRGLNNAHILGFLRRICKLIFYGIKPVFVFDGGAPALKRSTIVCIHFLLSVFFVQFELTRDRGRLSGNVGKPEQLLVMQRSQNAF